jgi:hypothetical protein
MDERAFYFIVLYSLLSCNSIVASTIQPLFSYCMPMMSKWICIIQYTRIIISSRHDHIILKTHLGSMRDRTNDDDDDDVIINDDVIVGQELLNFTTKFQILELGVVQLNPTTHDSDLVRPK